MFGFLRPQRRRKTTPSDKAEITSRAPPRKRNPLLRLDPWYNINSGSPSPPTKLKQVFSTKGKDKNPSHEGALDLDFELSERTLNNLHLSRFEEEPNGPKRHELPIDGHEVKELRQAADNGPEIPQPVSPSSSCSILPLPPLVFRPSEGTPYRNRTGIRLPHPVPQVFSSSITPFPSSDAPNTQRSRNPSIPSLGTDLSPRQNTIDHDPALYTAAAELKVEIVKNLISNLVSGITQATGSYASGSPENGSGNSIATSSNGEARNPQRSGALPNNKRSRYTNHNNQDEDDLSENSDDERRRKRKGKVSMHEEPARQRLKCPYYQRRPEEHRIASCRGQGFADMAKLKDHLKRVHTQPLRCTRCWEEVWTLDDHLRRDIICRKKPEPDDRRISPQQLQQLNFNRTPFAKTMSVEEKWGTLYRILFPDEKEVPSPYEQYGMSSQFEKLLILALEEELLRELGDVMCNIIDIVRERLPTIVSNCKERAISLSRASTKSIPSPLETATSSKSGVDSVFDEPEASNELMPLSTRPSVDLAESDIDLFAIPLNRGLEFSNVNFPELSFGNQDGPQADFGTVPPLYPDVDWDSLLNSI